MFHVLVNNLSWHRVGLLDSLTGSLGIPLAALATLYRRTGSQMASWMTLHAGSSEQPTNVLTKSHNANSVLLWLLKVQPQPKNSVCTRLCYYKPWKTPDDLATTLLRSEVDTSRVIAMTGTKEKMVYIVNIYLCLHASSTVTGANLPLRLDNTFAESPGR